MKQQRFTAADISATCFRATPESEELLTRNADHPGRYFLHNSPRSNRAGIQAKGLIMHNPFKDGNWPSLASSGGMHPQSGVFVFPLGDEPVVRDAYYLGCQYSGMTIPGHEHEPMDHWLIDGQGLDWKSDPDLPYAVILTENVPADRLKLVNDEVMADPDEVIDGIEDDPLAALESIFQSIVGGHSERYPDDEPSYYHEDRDSYYPDRDPYDY